MRPYQNSWKAIFSLVLLFILAFSAAQPMAKAEAQAQTNNGPQPITFLPVKFGVSAPVQGTSLPPEQTIPQTFEPTGPITATSLPAPVFIKEGLKNADNLQGVGTGQLASMPDVNGDVGPSHYIQVVNNLLHIISPSTGDDLETYIPISSLFAGFGGLCESNDEGLPPIVLYDHLADRWIISQMARDTNAPYFEYHQCVAVSQSPNPVGEPWYLYDFQIITSSADLYLNPRIAVWMNGYYMTLDQWNYNSATGAWSSAGQGVAVLERTKMLLGQNARMIYFDLFPSDVTHELHYLVPADLDGFPPPTDTPGYFVQIDDNGRGDSADQLRIFNLDVDWNNEFAFWGPVKDMPVSSFDSKFTCNTTTFTYDCIPQPGATPTQYLDVQSERLMYRVQYRYQDNDAHMILNHTVDVGTDHAGVRWYHLKTDAFDEWEVFDQGTISPDATNRWMGSAAMDASGNIAVGYSVSSSSVYPGIRYTGRLSTDPAGSMPQGEVTVVNGSGIQTDVNSRWGTISSMVVDPTDQCTFWYTNEYVAATGVKPWQTKIAKFNLGAGTCVTPPTSTISGFVTDAQTGEPIANAIVATSTGYMTKSGADGIYTLIGLPTDAVVITVSAIGYVTSSPKNATPPAVDVNFALSKSEDDYDGALVISGIPYMHNTDTTIATSASDDPSVTACGLGQGYATLWYQYTATNTQPVYMDTLGSDYDTFIAVWTGTRGSLSPVTCNNNTSGKTQSALTLSAVENVTYYIEVGQANVSANIGGNLKFHLVTFSDVAGNNWAWRYVEGLYADHVTGGCSTNPLKYCPDAVVTREQMAVFILRAKYGPTYSPPPVGSSTGFVDVPVTNGFAAWIKQLAIEQITGGCGGGKYCPKASVTREQMAVFLLRAKYGTSFVPDPAIGIFADVPTSSGFAIWIEKLAADGITGGCGGGKYCPKSGVTRAQMAIFLDKTFDIPLLP